jgi:hypothetical protein
MKRQFIQVHYNDHGGTNVSTNHIPMTGDDSDDSSLHFGDTDEE